MARRSGPMSSPSQMSGKIPSLTGAPGQYRAANAPFNQPQDIGNGGIPVKMMDGTRTTKATTSPTPGQMAAFGSVQANAKPRGDRSPARPPK